MRFNSIIPELSVKNLLISKIFYLEILEFTLEYERIENSFMFLSYGKAQIMLQQINGYWETGKMEHPFGRGVNFQIGCSDVETLVKKLLSNGYGLFQDIEEVSYKENEIEHRVKEFLVQDPDGYLLRFSQSIC
ncbi:bleomycin resistance protein [Paenibacillus piri]|uniref:Bleomycin resistance protein n=1 Tax=Paenibacillus piri TaxID=2547395 RepID=A0A4R5KEF8_9BACL|nr:VOC family protein [Paenibacillus piri]TDF93711.1 VOC family protein [Paenibacillus piri]